MSLANEVVNLQQDPRVVNPSIYSAGELLRKFRIHFQSQLEMAAGLIR